MSEEIKRLRSYLAVREANSQRSLQIGNHIHGFGTVTGEAALYASDIQSLLNAIEAIQAERDAADALAEVTEACLRMMDHALQGTGKGDMALKPDGSLGLVEGWKRLAAYKSARSKP